ncbi:MAG: hypothetical protein FWG35_07590 [Spirochaetaceae bacterium]|nr:hypothetical protein [Spirochaetaceae bacterium]
MERAQGIAVCRKEGALTEYFARGIVLLMLKNAFLLSFNSGNGTALCVRGKLGGGISFPGALRGAKIFIRRILEELFLVPLFFAPRPAAGIIFG